MNIYARIQQANSRLSVRLFQDEQKTQEAGNLSFPGVYTVIHSQSRLPFYVGESSNLGVRLKTLFRCHQSVNPHPCHDFYLTAYKCFPTPDIFCNSFHVEVINTTGREGRIEIEEKLQERHETNHSEYYSNWVKKSPSNNTNKLNPTNTNTAGQINSHVFNYTIVAGHQKHKQFSIGIDLADQLGGKGSSIYVRFNNGHKMTCNIGQHGKQKYINGGGFRNAFRQFANTKLLGSGFVIELEEYNSKPCLNFR